MKRFLSLAVIAMIPFSAFAGDEAKPAESTPTPAAVQTSAQEQKPTRFEIDVKILEEMVNLLNNPVKYQNANTMYLASLLQRIQNDVKPIPVKQEKK